MDAVLARSAYVESVVCAPNLPQLVSVHIGTCHGIAMHAAMLHSEHATLGS